MAKFSGWYNPGKTIYFEDHKEIQHETIIYVGCVHGGDEPFFKQLWSLVNEPPDYLIFTGDLTGSPELERLKTYYYNYVTNISKPLIEKDPCIADDSLLSHVGVGAPVEKMSLRQGYLCLYRYQLALENRSNQSIDAALRGLTDKEIAEQIRYLSSFPYYGNWAAMLPIVTRRALLNTLQKSAESIYEPIRQLRKKGCSVIMLEGNWDHPEMTGIKYIAGSDIEKYFDTKGYFIDEGIHFIDQLTALETKTTIQIFLPFAILHKYELTENYVYDALSAAVQAGRVEKKQIIMVGHSEPNTRIHNLAFSEYELVGERATPVRNFAKAIARFRPDEVIYSHQHNPLTDEDGQEIGANLKYLLETINSETSLVEEIIPEVSIHRAVVTYTPLRAFAKLLVPLHGSREIFSGDRLPIMRFT